MYQPLPHLICLIALLFSICSAAPLQSDPIEKRGLVPKLVGSPAIIGPGTYPRANRLADGSIIAAYTAFSGGYKIITTVRSTDGGTTWQPLGEVTRGPSATSDIDNPYILPLPSGKILCAFRNHSKNATTHAYTYFRLTITISSDGGKTWTYLSTPASDPGDVNGNWEPFLRTTSSGTSLQLYYSRENSKQDQDTLMRTSTDFGKTWSGPTTISGAGITSRDGMTGVATITGTSLIAVFESETTGLFTINAITSPDDGATWTNRRTIYTPSSHYTSAGAPQVVNIGGTLMVSFQTNEDEVLSAPAGDYVGSTSVKVIVSGDGGVSWGGKLTVSGVQSVWPGLYVLDGGSALVLYDHGGVKSQKVSLS